MNSYTILHHPIGGDLLFVANDTELLGLYFAGWKHAPALQDDWQENSRHPILAQAVREIQEYFDGQRSTFSLPLRYEGTDFQRKVWEQIEKIPFGETISYSELAQRVGAPAAVRAAGSATGKNPFSIITPCHRVLAKGGGFGGYAGGLDRKQWLLAVEKKK